MLNDLPVAGTPIAVVDLETTGLIAGADKIVEIAVVRVEPGGSPQLVLDTLVNPRQRVRGTEIHGITDADVAGAPTFADLKDEVGAALSGAVVASYNVYFDVRFLEAEFPQIEVDTVPPHLCLMYLRPMLGLGKKTTLVGACKVHGVPHGGAHSASHDAMAAAWLWPIYVARMQERRIGTFGELGALKKYKFVESFGSRFLGPPGGERKGARLWPRGARPTVERTPVVDAIALYWEAMLGALADGDFTEEEVAELEVVRRASGVTEEQMRWVHGRAFAAVIEYFGRDKAISEEEAERLAGMAGALRRLGWAPGDGAVEAAVAEGRRGLPERKGCLGSLLGW